MKGLFLKQIRRKRTATFLFLVSILLIATALPISITSIQQSQKQVETDITYYARGSYGLAGSSERSQTSSRRQTRHRSRKLHRLWLRGYFCRSMGRNQEKQRRYRDCCTVASLKGYFSGMKTTLALFPPEHDYNRYILQFYTTDGKS